MTLDGYHNDISPADVLRRERIVDGLDALHGLVATSIARMFPFIAELDRRGVWHDDGCHDMAEWLCGRYGFTRWDARRWVNASHALGGLPKIAAALKAGSLSVDKVVELTRFATPEQEDALIRWAKNSTVTNIRRRGDVEARPNKEEALAFENERSCSWWFFDDGRRMGLEAYMPAADGQLLIEAIETRRKQLPRSPEDPLSSPDIFGQDPSIDAKRVDALVDLARNAIGGKVTSPRPLLVVHADLDALVSEHKHAEIDGGGVIPPETLMRLTCDCDLEAVFHSGEMTLGIGRSARRVPARLMRQLRRRDRSCRFPGSITRSTSRHITSSTG